MNPGIYDGISMADYHAAPGLSSSGLHRIAKSPQHFMKGQAPETDAMRLGTAAHALLTPGAFEKNYARASGKRAARRDDGVIELTPLEWAACIGIRDSLASHPTCQSLLSEGAPEKSVWWIDPEAIILCKCRPDWSHKGILIDLKTTTDASPSGFARAVERYRYHVQAAWYSDGWEVASGVLVERFIFLAVEKHPPYAIGLYELPAHKTEEGRRLARENLEIYGKCLTARTWPGYSPDIETLSFAERPNGGYHEPSI